MLRRPLEITQFSRIEVVVGFLSVNNSFEAVWSIQNQRRLVQVMAFSGAVPRGLRGAVLQRGKWSMKTTATNRKVRELLSALKEKRLVPRPDFQRRLVWSSKDKSAFLETVLLNYPFPEIYVCAGSVDVETGEGTELLVDGQQRMTTLHQYFIGSPDLVLHNDVRPYAELSRPEKEAFLQYDVVVRDLGQLELDVVRSVFQRINATKYSLNAMEIHNSRYDGEFKQFAESLAQRPFFEGHRVFGAGDIRRMQDVRFALLVATTALGTYFNRDDELEVYLARFNDEFPMRPDVERELDQVFEVIEQMNPPPTSRIWGDVPGRGVRMTG